jgi:ribosomal protein S18 acetylase RimI-like enzyme
MEIRAGKDSDLPFVMALARSAFGQFGNPEDARVLWMHSGVSRFAAIENDAPVGFAMLCFYVEAGNKHVADFAALAVSVAARRRGVGQKLIEHVISAAQSANFSDELRLCVAATNEKARRLFHRAGFNPVLGDWGFYSGGQRVIRMTRSLQK